MTFKGGKYQAQCVIGTGTYGKVFRCLDRESSCEVAVKVAHREAAYRRSAIKEAQTLAALRSSAAAESVVGILESFEDGGCICIATELLYENVYEVMRKRQFVPFTLEEVRRIGRTTLTALSTLHTLGSIHCDVKPENVMLRDEHGRDSCLIDFGAVRQLHENQYYDVQSLWYRAPEVICGLPYTPLIDAWSTGCLLFELFTGNPLLPGDSSQDQITRIINLLGYPSPGASSSGQNSRTLCFTKTSQTTSLAALLLQSSSATGIHPNELSSFCDLLCRLLHPNEQLRMSCEAALQHPFFDGAQSPLQLSLSSLGISASSSSSLPSECSPNPTPLTHHWEAVPNGGNHFPTALIIPQGYGSPAFPLQPLPFPMMMSPHYALGMPFCSSTAPQQPLMFSGTVDMAPGGGFVPLLQLTPQSTFLISAPEGPAPGPQCGSPTWWPSVSGEMIY
jgi:serine/threonine protein kinase